MGVRNFTNTDFSKKYIQNSLSLVPGGFLIYRADESEEILFANRTLLDIFECETDEQFFEITGGTFKGLVYSEDLQDVEYSIKLQANAGGDPHDHNHYRIMTRSGKLKYVEDFGRLYDDPDEGLLYYVFVTSTHNKVDVLTGLPSRWLFMKLAEHWGQKATEDGGHPIVISFDFTGMKSYNNRMGLDAGDKILTTFAEILRNNFGSDRCSRFGEDHFYAFCDDSDSDHILDSVIIDFNTSATNAQSLPIRIGISPFNPDISMNIACNRAKAAADSLKGTQETSCARFNEIMSKSIWKREYIISHIHQAINERWVDPHYQPVVRTLNGRLCNLEALARWRDPIHGIIPPADFIPILEENGLSYKLDMYIVERVVTMLQHRLKEGLPVVPISVNISRSDFDYCDPVKLISDSCDAHDVRHNLIAVEITESALMSDQETIRTAIERFHAAGFEVWMDDFGSGYSSLNVLKDFDFDEIKIDMAFLRDFNERSRKIVTMAVKMAKSLGIHTLAEGVETEEHIDFLKSIGCERIQGYYYGKPDAITDQLQHLKQNGITFESRETATFYQKTGLLDFDSKTPLALFFFDGKCFTPIFMNSEYTEEIAIASEGESQSIETYMNSGNSVLGRKFRALAEKAINTAKTETMTFVVNSKYFHFSFTLVASSRHGSMLSASIDGSAYEEHKQVRRFDEVIRNITSGYESIYLIDIESDRRTVIISSLPNEDEGDVVYGLEDFYSHYDRRYIHVDDLERFRKAMCIPSIEERFRDSGRVSYTEIFPVKKTDGNYEWTAFLIIKIPDSKKINFLICVKRSEIEDQRDKKSTIERLINLNGIELDPQATAVADWWNSMILESDAKFFWKDTKRRFLGASRAFLDYYGMRSSRELLGKTDEEMGWHVNDSPYRSDEMDVLEKGVLITNSPGINIVKGIPRQILTTKFPAYHDGKIIGLMGHFLDVEQDIKKRDSAAWGNSVDGETGLLDSTGMLATLIELDKNLRQNNEDFTFVMMKIHGHDEFIQTHSANIADSITCEIARAIKSSFPDTAVIARNSGSGFSAVMRGAPQSEVKKITRECQARIARITSVEGYDCSLKMLYGIARGSEDVSILRILDKAGKRLEEYDEEESAFSEGKEIVPDIYNDIPIPFIIVQGVKDDSGEITDAKYLFANQKYCELMTNSKANLIGNDYMKLFPRNDKKWLEYARRAMKGEYVSGKLFGGTMKHWLKFTMMPAELPDSCAIVMDIIDKEMQDIERNSIAQNTMNAILGIAATLKKEKDYNVAVNKAILELGTILKADRLYIFTTDRRTFTNPFEWCKNGVPSEIRNRQNLRYKYLAAWEKIIEKDGLVNIKDVNLLKHEYPTVYNYFKSREIERLIAAPLYMNDELFGYLCADNYSLTSQTDTKMMMDASAHMIANRLMMEKILDERNSAVDEKNALRKSLMIDSICMEVSRILTTNLDYRHAVNEAISVIGTELDCDRVFVMTKIGDKISNTFEWCNKDIESVIDKWQNIDFSSYVKDSSSSAKNWTSSIIEDISMFKPDIPVRYELMRESKIERVIETPVYNHGKLSGFIGIDNYSKCDTDEARRLLEITARHLGSRSEIHRLRKITSDASSIEKLRATTKEILELTTKIESAKGGNDEIILKSYEQLPIPCALVKIIMNDTGSFTQDLEYIFVNEAYCRFIKRPRESIIGRKYTDIYIVSDPQLKSDFYKATVFGEPVTDQRFHDLSGHWVETSIVPLSARGFCCITINIIDSDHRKIMTQKNRLKMDEVILNVAKMLTVRRNEHGIIREALKEMGRILSAEHIFLLSLAEDKFTVEYDFASTGITPITEKFRGFPRIHVHKPTISGGMEAGHRIFDSLDAIKEADYELYDYIRSANIRNMIQAPIFSGNTLGGYIGVGNFNEKKKAEIKMILSNVSVFFAGILPEAQL